VKVRLVRGDFLVSAIAEADGLEGRFEVCAVRPRRAVLDEPSDPSAVRCPECSQLAPMAACLQSLAVRRLRCTVGPTRTRSLLN